LIAAAALLGVVAVAVLVVTVLVRQVTSAQMKKFDAFFTAAQALQGKTQGGDSSAKGRRHGLQVTFHLTTRGSGSGAEAWTEIDVIRPATSLVLELRPERRHERRLKARALTVDVETGDPAFDEAFLVEAAPSDVALALLDADVRARLLALAPVAIAPANAWLRLEKRGWIEEPERVVEAIDLAATIAARIPAAFAAADAALQRPAGTPYRPQVDAGETRAAKARRDEEIAELRARKDRRREWERRNMFLYGAAVLVFVAAAVLLNVLGVVKCSG
jgi:hypothetical protein